MRVRPGSKGNLETSGSREACPRIRCSTGSCPSNQIPGLGFWGFLTGTNQECPALQGQQPHLVRKPCTHGPQ